MYGLLKSEYNRSLKNTPIYILWDRDFESNNTDIVRKSLNTFHSALDNNYDMNGLLLLSYPCIEVFELSNFVKRLWKEDFKSSNDAKKKMKEQIPSIYDISEKTLLLALENMHISLRNLGIINYDPSYFKDNNLEIFDKIEDEYKKDKIIKALSLICIMFVDLGIIEEKVM